MGRECNSRGASGKCTTALSDPVLDKLADEFQPQLEMFRLRKLTGDIANSAAKQVPASEIARIFAPFIPDDPEIVTSLLPLFESQQEELLERRKCDVRRVLVEVLWDPAHSAEKLTATNIAERVNALLRNRDAPWEYNSRQIGKQLKKLGLGTKRGIWQSSPELRQRIHELAREFQLSLPLIQGCPQCAKSMEKKAPV